MRILSLEESHKINGNGKSHIVAGIVGALSLGYVAGKVAHPIVGWSVGAILLSVILGGNLIVAGIPNEMNSQ